jgi:hypothetical protein
MTEQLKRTELLLLKLIDEGGEKTQEMDEAEVILIGLLRNRPLTQPASEYLFP